MTVKVKVSVYLGSLSLHEDVPRGGDMKVPIV